MCPEDLLMMAGFGHMPGVGDLCYSPVSRGQGPVYPHTASIYVWLPKTGLAQFRPLPSHTYYELQLVENRLHSALLHSICCSFTFKYTLFQFFFPLYPRGLSMYVTVPRSTVCVCCQNTSSYHCPNVFLPYCPPAPSTALWHIGSSPKLATA